MSKVVVERDVPVVATDGESGSRTASNFIWALAFIIIVGIIVGALYYSGFLRRVTNQQPSKVNVTVQQPAAPAQ
jgi:NADH:ubiquinone oxidoreductase subunit 2 (subunit N)